MRWSRCGTAKSYFKARPWIQGTRRYRREISATTILARKVTPSGALVTSQPRRTLAQLAADLATLRISSRELVTDCLARISSVTGEGSRTFLKVYAEPPLAPAHLSHPLPRHTARPS